MVIPKINSAHGSDTRNILNRAIDLINVHGKTIQDLVAEGQLTPTQYAQLISIVNGNISKGSITADDIDKNNFKLDQTYMSDSFLQMMAGDTPVNAVPADNSISRGKLTHSYNRQRLISTDEDLTGLSAEGVYFKETPTTLSGLPSEMGDGFDESFLFTVQNFGGNNVVQHIYNLYNNRPHYYRILRNNNPTEWRSVSDDSRIFQSISQELIFNHNSMERHSDAYIPNDVISLSNAVQSVEVIGVNPETPIGFWMICNNRNTWNDRIMLRQKVDGEWTQLVDSTANLTVLKNETGATDVSFTRSGITVNVRVDYNLIPDGGRFIDQPVVDSEPFFIIRPENVKLDEDGTGGGESYDQSLNTFDNVQFSTVKADAIEVAGDLPTGTISDTPAGLMAGDMWLDTTDSAEHPILRVMT